MLKGKEVVGDPKRQYEIAREVHLQQENGSKGHAGISMCSSPHDVLASRFICALGASD